MADFAPKAIDENEGLPAVQVENREKIRRRKDAFTAAESGGNVIKNERPTRWTAAQKRH